MIDDFRRGLPFGLNFFPLPEIWSSSGGWVDYDADGRLDVAINGNSLTGSALVLYRNNLEPINAPPLAPSGLAAAVFTNTAVLTWTAASDAQTVPSALTYNLRVGRAPGAADVLSPLSDSNGWRQIVAAGNAGQNTRLALKNLAPGTYYWTVQAIDTAFAGSSFAPEQSFTVHFQPILRLTWVQASPPACELRFTGRAGESYPVQASADLLNWGTIGLATPLGSNEYQFIDSTATNPPARFYRLTRP